MADLISQGTSLKERFLRTANPLIIALWLSLLFFPFKGWKAALVSFAVFSCIFISAKYISGLSKKILVLAGSMRHRIEASGLCSCRSKKILQYVLLVGILILPFMLRDYFIDVAVLVGIYMILALGLNVVVGFAGLLNLGFVAFYAIGAYTYALLNIHAGIGFWPALPLAVGLSAAAGFLLAVPALRLRGDYLAIVTLGFGEITRLILNNWDSLTRGPNGLSGIEPPSILSVSFGTLTHYYYLVLVFVLITFFVTRRVYASRIGRAWVAIREDEIAASVMGIHTTMYKLYAFAFGAFWAGLAGAVFAGKMQFISPESFTFMESVLILCMVILGGIGSIAGVIIGSVILVLLPEILREVQLYRMLLLGAGLVLLMVFRPQGLFGGKGVSLRS
ncbi:MAG: branched-chain amino acid ABC transporter permease [Nitrospirota bacterium]